MSKNFNMFPVPRLGLNLISGGVGAFIAFMGIKLFFVPNFTVKVSDTLVVTTHSAIKLEKVTEQVEERADIIRQRDDKYDALKAEYQKLLYQGIEHDGLGRVIEEINSLPTVPDTTEIKEEIQDIQDDLIELANVE